MPYDLFTERIILNAQYDRVYTVTIKIDDTTRSYSVVNNELFDMKELGNIEKPRFVIDGFYILNSDPKVKFDLQSTPITEDVDLELIYTKLEDKPQTPNTGIKENIFVLNLLIGCSILYLIQQKKRSKN